MNFLFWFWELVMRNFFFLQNREGASIIDCTNEYGPSSPPWRLILFYFMSFYEKILVWMNPFHATALFLYPLKTSLMFSGDRERPVEWHVLISWDWVEETSGKGQDDDDSWPISNQCSHFIAPWKHRETFGILVFLVFSGVRKWQQWSVIR